MKNFITFAAIIVLVVTFASNASAQTKPAQPYLAKNAKTNQQILVVPELPTATITYYSNGDIAIKNDERIITYYTGQGNGIAAWKQIIGHQPVKQSNAVAVPELIAKAKKIAPANSMMIANLK